MTDHCYAVLLWRWKWPFSRRGREGESTTGRHLVCLIARTKLLLLLFLSSFSIKLLPACNICRVDCQFWSDVCGAITAKYIATGSIPISLTLPLLVIVCVCVSLLSPSETLTLLWLGNLICTIASALHTFMMDRAVCKFRAFLPEFMVQVQGFQLAQVETAVYVWAAAACCVWP